MSPEHGGPHGDERIRLSDGRLDHLRLRPEVWQAGVRGARRAAGAKRAEREILAASVVREDGPIGPHRDTDNNATVYWQGARLYVGMLEAVEAGADEWDAVERAIEADPAVLEDADTDALQAADRMSSVEDMLKRYHPDIGERPRDERIALLVQGARHMDEAWWALEEFGEFCQVGSQHGRPRKKTADAELDARAAELKDARGLSHREIGTKLSIPLSDHDRVHGGHGKVRGMVKRGRARFTKMLGAEGYGQYIEDLSRWHELDERQRIVQSLIETTAGQTGRPLEEVEAMRPRFERLLDEHLSEDDQPRT